MTADKGDLVQRLQEESLQLARRSFDSVDAGISANLCDEAIDEIERLRAVKRRALALADERAKEANELCARLAIARKALELAEDVLSRSPFSTDFWPNGMHPQVGIEQIRTAIKDSAS